MKKYIKQIFKLFLPLFLTKIGMFSLSFVDSVMLGYSESEHIGLQSIGDTPVTIILLIMDGLVAGTLFTTSQSFGKKDFVGVGQSLRSALRFGMYLSFITIPCFIFIPQILTLFNYTPEQTEISSNVARILCAAIPFSIMFFICTSFLNGVRKTWVITFFVIFANIINVLLDWILINGAFGTPRLLSVGAAWATSAVRVFMGGGLLLYILMNKDFKKFKIWSKDKNIRVFEKQKNIGLSATSNMLSYELAMSFCLFYVANIDIIQASAYTLAYRIFILSNIIGCCFAEAGVVSCGRYVDNNSKELQKIYEFSFLLNILIMFFVCFVCFLCAKPISFMMTSDAELYSLTIPLLRIASVAMFMRALNSVQIILLRNINCLVSSSVFYNLGFLVVTPVSCVLFGNLFSASGVLWAVVLGNMTVVMFLHCIFVKKGVFSWFFITKNMVYKG